MQADSREDTSLLADDSELIETSKYLNSSRQYDLRPRLMAGLTWCLKNLVMVTLAGLLLAGTVAVCTYGGKIDGDIPLHSSDS